jgi:hypothetical protein
MLHARPRRNARSTLDLLEQVVEEMPFAIQRAQPDRGQERFAYDVNPASSRLRPASRPWLSGTRRRLQSRALHRFVALN